MTDLKGKKVAVLGLGVEGLSSVSFLASKGADVTILDIREDVLGEIKKLRNKDIKTSLGKQYLDNLDRFDFIVRSPGVKLSLPELAKLEPSTITSQTKLFFNLCPARIIGITGTKGKGTTASLIYEMLKAQVFDVYLGGNIGVAPFEFLDKLTPQSWVVLELSSFQLQDLTKSPASTKAMAGKPHIAVILMITSEHLDYHKTLYEYVDAKRNLLRFQTNSDYAIINRDYPASNESDIHTEGKVYYVTRERDGVNGEGCFVRDGTIIVQVQSSETKVIDTKDILLPGKHNLENVCAAVMAATLAGVSKQNIVGVLKTFKGLEHRLELVGTANGVKYYDDSFSTTPETAIAAIQAFEEPEILILGGSSKNSDFSELGRVIRDSKNIKAIIGVGVEWEKIKSEIRSARWRTISEILLIEGAKNMQQIVTAASKIAKPGDVVLLSPACASFDMFKNYKDRGEQFKKEVLRL